MATPENRRIIFGSYVVASKSVEMEEPSIRHTEFLGSTSNDSLSKTLGGRGNASINVTQTNSDGWTSMDRPEQRWEELDSNWDIFYQLWGSPYITGELDVTTTLSDHQLSSDSNDLAFLYIKNTGDTNNAEVSLTGSSGTRYIYIPPNGSVNLRGDGTNLECNEVYVQSNTSTTTIEYIIANE